MNNSVESFLKRISFFLIYLPALIYGCQIAYFSGISEPLGIDVASLGMNYFEVSFFGYLNLSNSFLENFNKLMWFILGFIIFFYLAFFLYMLAIHPSEKENQKHKIMSIFFTYGSHLDKGTKRANNEDYLAYFSCLNGEIFMQTA